MRRVAAVGGAAAVLILGMGAKGCGSTSVNSTPIATSPASNGSAAPTTTPAPPASVAHVGAAISVTDQKGNMAAVTLAQVIDPAQGGDQFTTPNAGDRFVGAKFVITGTKGTVSDDAEGDATVIGSDNQTYQPDFASMAGCTNFDSGQFTVPAGQSSTGCIMFQIPQAVKVAKVRFDVNSGFGNNIAQWLVP